MKILRGLQAFGGGVVSAMVDFAPLMAMWFFFAYTLLPLEGQDHNHGTEPTPSPVAHAEMAAVEKLLDPAQATHVVSGRTSKLTIPEGAFVFVPAGKTLTVDSDLTCQQFRHDGEVIWEQGNLAFVTATSIGRFSTVGDTPRHVRFIPRGPRDRVRDPADISGGWIVMSPDFQMHGELKAPWLVPVDFQARTLTFAAPPLNWRVGDRLIIPGLRLEDPDDYVLIAGVDGNTVTLDQAVTPRTLPSGRCPAVGNLTRSLNLYSEDPELSQRAHFMVMHQHTGSAISFVRFWRMGRTDADRLQTKIVLAADGTFVRGDENTIGRYVDHIHCRIGATRDAPPHVREGNVYEGSPRHGFVNHGGHVDVRRNIAVHCGGSCFFEENGLGLGGFIENLASDAFGRQSAIKREDSFAAGDFGADGHCIWLQSGAMEVRGNELYRAKTSLIEIVGSPITEAGNKGFPVAELRPGPVQDALVRQKKTHTTIDDVPGLITDNMGSGSRAGFASQKFRFRGTAPEEETPFLRNRLYNCVSALRMTYTGSVRVEDCDLVGTFGIFNGRVGGIEDEPNTAFIRVLSSKVRGFPIGLSSRGGLTQATDNELSENVMNFHIPFDAPLDLARNKHLGRELMTAKHNATAAKARVGTPCDYFFTGTPAGQSAVTVDGRPIFFSEQAGFERLSSNVAAWIEPLPEPPPPDPDPEPEPEPAGTIEEQLAEILKRLDALEARKPCQCGKKTTQAP
jgi:hypothetical protein